MEKKNVVSFRRGEEITTLTLAFSARAASQEITVPSDATKKTFTIHSYRDTVVNGKVSKSDIIDFTTNIVYDPPVSSSNAWVFTKKTANDAVSYNLEVDISANSGSSSRTATITLTQATSGKTITITITQKALDPIIKLELSFADQSPGLIGQGPVPYTLSYNDQFLETGTIPAGGVIQVPQNTWADNGGDTAIYTLYLKGSEIKAGSTFYFQCKFYAINGINGWEDLLVDPEYNKALNYKIDTVQPLWNTTGIIRSGTIYLYKGNLSPSDFSGGILIELTLGTEINGYVKKAMIRVKVN